MNVPFLDIKDVWFRYRDDWVLIDIDFCVERGEFLGIIGPNGSGKTTLLKILGRTLMPEKGIVRIEGEGINHLSRRAIACKIGFVPQRFLLNFPFSVKEVVLMGRSPYLNMFQFEGAMDHEKAERAMRLTDTHQFASRSIHELSEGERQRVLIARALAQEPQILILDEPTAFLDLKHQVDLFEILKSLNEQEGLTVIQVSHDINLAAQYCKRIILLHQGRIFKAGTSEEVINEKDLYTVYQTPILVDHHPFSNSPRISLITRNS
jgi:iron complex transport system ATP-binding protein